MTAEYPRDAQNPPTEHGARPDEQPAPRQRVKDHTSLRSAEHDQSFQQAHVEEKDSATPRNG